MIRVLMIAKAMEKTGVSSVMFAYYDCLDRSRFQVDFLTGDIFEEEYKERVEKNGDHFYIVPGRDKKLISYINTLSKIIRRKRYHIVHVHGNSAMIFPELIAAKLGGAQVRIAHSHNTMCNHPQLEMIARPIFNLFYTDGLACSEEAGQWMFKKQAFQIINNGIQAQHFVFSQESRKAIRAELGIGDEHLIGHIGYFNYQKNHKRLISIFEKVHQENGNTKLLLIGEGNEKNAILRLVGEKNLSDAVIFYGLSDNIPAMLSAMDCFLFPSHFEGFGIVLLEAQASGLSCIASSEVPKQADVTNTVCFLDLQESDDIWAGKAIQQMQNTPSNRQRRSIDNIELIKQKKYDTEMVSKELERFYLKALKRL